MTAPTALRALKAAATPGEMRAFRDIECSDGTVCWQLSVTEDDGFFSGYRWLTPEDAAYIVAACNAVPELLDEIERLRAGLKGVMDTDCVAGETPFLIEQRLHAIAHKAWLR